MSRDDVLPDELPDTARPLRWRSLLSWSVFLGLGLLVWELTDRSGLAASVACLKFGVDEAATGIYLLRNDPLCRRGITCCMFHLARGCGKFGSIGILASLLVELGRLLVQGWLGLPGPPPGQLWHPAILGIVGVCLWIMFSAYAVGVAVVCQLSIWIDSTTRDSRKAGIWPPRPVGKNRVRLNAIVGTALGSHILSCFAIPARLVGEWIFFVTLPVMLVCDWWVANRISARTPDECWPDDNPVDLHDYEAQSDSAGTVAVRLVSPGSCCEPN